jgi:hypothetical protein
MDQADRIFLAKKNYHQRGEPNMTQGVIPFKYEEEKSESRMTALAGLPIYLDLARVLGLSASIQKHVKVRENSQGWTDSQSLTSLILLNLAGGTSIDDLKISAKSAGNFQEDGVKRKSVLYPRLQQCSGIYQDSIMPIRKRQETHR